MQKQNKSEAGIASRLCYDAKILTSYDQGCRGRELVGTRPLPLLKF